MENLTTQNGYVITPEMELLIKSEILLATGETITSEEVCKLCDIFKSLTDEQ